MYRQSRLSRVVLLHCHSNIHLVLASALLLTSAVVSAGEPFFQNGKTDWKIYLSPQADPTEVYAAQELQGVLKKISGAEFEVVSLAAAPVSRAIIIGDLKNPEVQSQADALRLSAGEVEEIAVYTLGERLYLAGNQPRGALYAVYSFLQRELGVRWLWPGSSGEFMPTKTSWTLPKLAFNHRPAIRYRGFHLCGDWRDHQIFREWMARNFINIHRHAASAEEKRMGFYSMWSSHNARVRDKSIFDQHPEYFAEVQGMRYRENICFSNPGVLGIVAESMAEYIRKRPELDILSIFPSDNQTYCRCDECAKTDVSTAWFGFYNRLTDTLKQEFPELRFATIAYQGYRAVPKCRIRNSEFVEYASYMRCNVHPFGHPDCKLNDDISSAFLEWKATGLPIGNYAYEYDIFSKNRRFAPFLSMIDNAIKTGKKLGHVSMITEILLSPKRGPDVYVNNVQNRLSIYLYARLLWDPDQSMTDILRDWCQTAFGKAAGPMFDYYTAMDRAWAAMPIHKCILGDALSVNEFLFANKLQDEAAAAFAAAHQTLGTVEDSAMRERWMAAFERERILFKQWQDLYQMQRVGVPRLNLPLLAQAADFAQSSCRVPEFGGSAADARSYATEVRLAWTQDALLAKWLCHDPQIDSLKALAVSRDGNVLQDDSVELVLANGISGETWHFAANPKGTKQDYLCSYQGDRQDRWNPNWEVKTHMGADRWEVEMTIPFASLGYPPNPNESWDATFLRHNGGRMNLAPAVFPAKGTAMLFFSSAARTDRVLLWWSGAPERESRRDAALKQAFTEIGWQIHLASTQEHLSALNGKCDAFWFRHPHGPNKVPADYWKQHVMPAVQAGGLAVFASYWHIPLDLYFNDPSFKVKVVTTGKIPLAGRRSHFIAPGDWSRKPNDLLPRLTSRITPAYGFVPEVPSAWTVLATAPRSEGEPFPYVLTRPYGKGTIILCGDAIPIAPAKMLDNFVEYHSGRH